MDPFVINETNPNHTIAHTHNPLAQVPLSPKTPPRGIKNGQTVNPVNTGQTNTILSPSHPFTQKTTTITPPWLLQHSTTPIILLKSFPHHSQSHYHPPIPYLPPIYTLVVSI